MKSKKLLILTLGLILLISLVGCQTASIKQQPYKNVGLQEAKKLIAQGVRVIDVREPSEYEVGHIPQAELVPLATVSEASQSWDKNEPLLLVCLSGMRSAQAAETLAKNGFARLYNFQGGMSVWDGEVVKETKEGVK